VGQTRSPWSGRNRITDWNRCYFNPACAGCCVVDEQFRVEKPGASRRGNNHPHSSAHRAGGPYINMDQIHTEELLDSDYTVSRLAQVHTDRPAGPRTEIIEYTIQSGDTLFGIAEKYGLKPQTLLWSNRHILGDDPHNIFPGVSILIPTIDGAIYFWNQGDGLNGVSKFYNVTPDVIIDWPSNNLNRESLGDLSMPNIAPGTMLFVPGGEGQFTDWLPHYAP